MGASENTNMERQIIAAAKQVFIEKGFTETCMNDIAVRVGINRSGLHYYFRTKEKLFEAVFSDIVMSFIPSIHSIILQDKPIAERVAEIADIYFDVFSKEPGFPFFIVREMQRNADYVLSTIGKLDIGLYAARVKEKMLSEMDKGNLRRMPIQFIIYTFFGLVTFPFLSKPLIEKAFLDSPVAFDGNLQSWKAYVIRQMVILLTPDSRSGGSE